MVDYAVYFIFVHREYLNFRLLLDIYYVFQVTFITNSLCQELIKYVKKNKMVDDSSIQQIDLIIHYGTSGKSEFLYL